MLLLIDEQKNHVRIFCNYSGLYNYIEACEKQRNASKVNKRKGQLWVFTRHFSQRMATYQDIFTQQAANGNEASRIGASGWDILEIVSGNPAKPVFISLAHGLDVEPLQKNWCRHYCKTHGLNLIEVADISEFRKLNQRFGN